jgi:hypothetical protein
VARVAVPLRCSPSCGRGRVECACVCVSGRQTSGGIAEEATPFGCVRRQSRRSSPSARGVHFSLL